MRNQVSAFKARLLCQAAAVALLAGMGASCSATDPGFHEPFITGSTANQREILTGDSQPMPAPVSDEAAVSSTDLAAPTDVSPTVPAATASAGSYGWSSASGKVVRVGPGESLDTLALKYGVPGNEIAKANDIKSPSEVRKGKMIVIPTRVAMAAPAAPVASGPVVASLPKAPEIAPAPAPTAPSVAPLATPEVASSDPADQPSATGTSFRWPVRGRIISSFGAKSNGERNDGINLAVPEGTSVKAAEAGTVIYSGNELPGYGNLILIRHADGWVSA